MRKLRMMAATIAVLACLNAPTAMAAPAAVPTPSEETSGISASEPDATDAGDTVGNDGTTTKDADADASESTAVDAAGTDENEVDDAARDGGDAGTVAVQSDGTVTLDDTVRYEGTDVVVAVDIAGTATFADGTAPRDADAVATSADTGLDMTVDVLDETDPAYESARTYAQNDLGAADAADVTALDFAFRYQEHDLDVSDCTLTATITPTAELQQSADQVAADAGGV